MSGAKGSARKMVASCVIVRKNSFRPQISDEKFEVYQTILDQNEIEPILVTLHSFYMQFPAPTISGSTKRTLGAIELALRSKPMTPEPREAACI